MAEYEANVEELVALWAREASRAFDRLSPWNRITAYRLLAQRLQAKIPPKDWFLRELLLFFPAGTSTAAIMEGVEAACRYFAESEDMYGAFSVGKTVAEAAANRLFLEARAASGRTGLASRAVKVSPGIVFREFL